MKLKGITVAQLTECLESVNRERGYKLIFNRRPEIKGEYIHFTIRSERSKIPGARTSYRGVNLISASWHSHGYLFDKIWDINPNAIIYSGSLKMTSKKDNWQDYNIGSIMLYPMRFSQTSIL
jgi:hypothetical protein